MRVARAIATSSAPAVAVFAIALAALAQAATPTGAQCGQTIDLPPRVAAGPEPPPLAVGDSVLYDAAEALAGYGFHINAMVCRTMAQGLVWLSDHARDVPGVVVVALGTNGAVTRAQIDELLSLVGPGRVLAVVTPHHGNYAYVPGLIRASAHQHSGRMLVLDWNQLSAGHPSWFAPDGIHLGSAAGVAAYARLVASALLATPASVPTVTVTTPAQPKPAAQPRPRSRVPSALLGPLLTTVAAVDAWLAGW